MTPQEAIATVHACKIIECTPDQWSEIRAALHAAAKTYIEQHDARALTALGEIKRLDAKFRYKENT